MTTAEESIVQFNQTIDNLDDTLNDVEGVIAHEARKAPSRLATAATPAR